MKRLQIHYADGAVQTHSGVQAFLVDQGIVWINTGLPDSWISDPDDEVIRIDVQEE